MYPSAGYFSLCVCIVVVVVVGSDDDDDVVVESSDRYLRFFPFHGKKASDPVFSIDDDQGVGRVFDGIGAISGGGVGWILNVPPQNVLSL